MPGTISIEQALIYTMVTMSGVEGKINAIELAEIRQLVKHLPIFRDFDEHAADHRGAGGRRNPAGDRRA